MAEEFANDSLKELENKVGRKTPESLLIWMKDEAAHCEETWRGDADYTNLLKDDMSAKIKHLKQEMRWLRSTDVRILRQLLAVHEGIEAVQWLVDERGASVSQSSSLSGSLSSLITVDEPGLSHSRYRGSLTSTQDFTENAEEDLTHGSLHTADVGHKNYLSPDYIPERHPSVFSAHKFPVSPFPKESRPQHSDRGDPNLVRRALLRSSRISSREEKPSNNVLKYENVEESKEGMELQDVENKRTNRDTTGLEESKMLLVYDAQWCWVESQDDVTFL